jgi:plastocyanin
MSLRHGGWLGAAIIAVGLAVMVVGSAGGGTPGYAPGWMMGPGMMGYGPAPTAPAGSSVRMAGSRFEPATLTVVAGTTVRWFNDDTPPHTVTAADGSWDSGNLAPGGSFERRFDTGGSYAYLCRYHPGMTGTVVVTGP